MVIGFDKLPDYYPTMYLDGYTPEQILLAAHRTFAKEYDAKQKEKDTIKDINIKVKIL